MPRPVHKSQKMDTKIRWTAPLKHNHQNHLNHWKVIIETALKKPETFIQGKILYNQGEKCYDTSFKKFYRPVYC